MSLFYDILVSNKVSLSEVESVLLQLGDEVFSQLGKVEILRDEKLTRIYNPLMSLSLSKGSLAPKFRGEDLGLALGHHISFYPASTLFKEWPRYLTRFVDRLLRSISGDLLLESNGDTPVLERRDMKVNIDIEFHSRNWPFDELSVEYTKMDLKQSH